MRNIGIKKVFKNPELQKLSLLIVTFGLVLLVSSFSLGIPLRKFFFYQRQLRKIKTDTSILKKEILKKDSLIKEIGQLRLSLAKYEKMFPQEIDIPEILAYLSEVAQISYVRINRIIPLLDQEKRGRGYLAIPLAVDVRGGYHQIAKFINKIENSERFMIINNLEIRANPYNWRQHDAKFIIYTYMVSPHS